MTEFKLKYLFLFVPIVIGVLILITFILLPTSKYPYTSTDTDNSSSITLASTGSIAEGISSYQVSQIDLVAPIQTSITLPEGYELNKFGIIPNFITINGSQLIIDASKRNVGEYEIYLKDPLSDLYNETFYITLSISLKEINTDSITEQIQNYLGDQSNNYGVFVYDINRDKSFGLNSDQQFRAASMVKIPIAVTIMREVQEGRLSLGTVYPLRGDLIFNYEVGAGINPIGSPLTVADYLLEMITESDNTSLSHLDAILGEIYGSDLNNRIKQVTGVDFYVNPPETTPQNVATVLKGLYSYSFLNQENSEYIINLMHNAVDDLKQGVGLGLPSGVDFVNKIGFLYTDEDLSYMDSAIVYGSSTDYVLVVMDKNQDWDTAKNNIQNISSIIYNNLN